VSTQINLRFDDDTTAALDELAAKQGRTRAEVVREAVHRRLTEEAGERIGDAYRSAYGEHPETPVELERAERSASRLTSDEPWEPWW